MPGAIREGRVRDKVKDWPLVAFSKQPVNFMGKFFDNSRLERTVHTAKWQKRNLKRKRKKESIPQMAYNKSQCQSFYLNSKKSTAKEQRRKVKCSAVLTRKTLGF